MHEIIHLDKPYQFARALKRIQMDPLIQVVPEEETLHLPMWIHDQPEVITVQRMRDGAFHIRGRNGVDIDEVFRQLRRILQWEAPLVEAAEALQKTELAPLFPGMTGVPLIGEFQLYGALMKTIIHQQLNMTFAYTLSTRFVQTFGFEKEGVWFYPRPETTAGLQVEDLRKLQFSGRKAEYVIDTSKKAASGELNLEEMMQEPDEVIIKKLTAVRGIGRWTAENMLMFGYGRRDLFPVQDIGILNALKKLRGTTEKPDKDLLDFEAQAFAPYRTYAALYLWESIEG
ncbi:DNA-3-methyladenine glycosylase family protein [Alkalicoccus urumqiensis]|uniref:DNA-3-methyladenine glycosylase II n=1 Tax=Alkalicoccus urumqiensis TaxID=1548213 RepID=A0A2P6MGM1_ALKUR|nr:DNA-3-methyladenine glycosylase [Alkalicoccus urumqiensis]PRO65438.1 DNA-3-methyladenine glycosylase [Alkalicoccus urumqiensis]